MPGLLGKSDDHGAHRLRSILRHPAGESAQEEAEAPVPHITVQDLKAKLDREETFQLIDVREPYEWDICHIPGATLIPLGQLPARA